MVKSESGVFIVIVSRLFVVWQLYYISRVMNLVVLAHSSSAINSRLKMNKRVR